MPDPRGLHRRRLATDGFTLVELLIVLAIIGIVSASVVLAIPDSGDDLRNEAERFAARAHAVREKAIIDGRPTAIRVTSYGYGFDTRRLSEWQPIDQQPFDTSRWSPGVTVSVGGEGAGRIIFDPLGTTEQRQLTLQRGDDRSVVTIEPGGDIQVRE